MHCAVLGWSRGGAWMEHGCGPALDLFEHCLRFFSPDFKEPSPPSLVPVVKWPLLKSAWRRQ